MAEGGGLLNRCTVKSCTGGSNPPLSARLPVIPITYMYMHVGAPLRLLSLKLARIPIQLCVRGFGGERGKGIAVPVEQ